MRRFELLRLRAWRRRATHAGGSRLLAFATLSLLFTASCTETDECAPKGPFHFACGFQAPEDLALMPADRGLLVSEMALGDGRPGRLSWIDPLTMNHQVAFPGPTARPVSVPEGSTDCPGPPDSARFAPHGIDLSPLSSGELRLFVVNHGGRESIEIFSVSPGRADPALRWSGCIPLPPDVSANDVVSLSSGLLAVTNSYPTSAKDLEAMRDQGAVTGNVLLWSAATGWTPLADSESSFPNGIEASSDGRFIYWSSHAGRKVIRVSRSGDSPPAEVSVPFMPDNMSWSHDGKLLVTGQASDMQALVDCYEAHDPECKVAFAVFAIDPESMQATERFSHDGRSFGGATVAVERGLELWIGSFASTRLAILR